MAMLQMQRIFIYGLRKDRKPILELLQRRGVIEVNGDIPEDNVFHKSDMSYAKSGFEKNIANAQEAVEILNGLVPEQKSLLAGLSGRQTVSTEEYHSFRNKYEATVKTAKEIIAYHKAIAENKAEILKLEANMEILKPWIRLDIPINFKGTKYTKSFIGSLPKEYSLEELYQVLAEYTPLNIDIISSNKDQTCIFVLCQKEKAEKVYETLRANDFIHPDIVSDKAPAELLEELEKRIIEAKKNIEQAEESIKALAPYRKDIKFLQDYDKMRMDKYEVIGQLSQSKNLFILQGFIAEKDAKALEEELNRKFDLYVEFETPSQDEEVPVLLKNNGFARPLEDVVAGFSLPGPGEIDPTFMVSLFYYMLFGIMLADAGYGAIMVIGCGLALLKFGKTMEESLKNFIKMFLYCGISTMFWGIMFGSFFGDIVDVIATNFFGATKTPILPPLWFFPVEKPMKMLVFSMLLGIIHLLTGVLVKTYQLIRQKDYISILYDCVSWFALVFSCVILLLSMEMITNIFSINIELPPMVAKVFGVIAIVSAIVIILTNGRESKNPFKRFLKGAYALYGITGYLSDVLSYSRLLALGLASGVIGNVVNKMAGMAGSNGPFGIVLFILIIVIGHVLNFAINILGAYVHTNRLQYVEFFGKFYEGGGRPFNPFQIKTKYYKVKEKLNNES